jgi:ABC-type hemin transport system substrate-binding protein
MTALPCLALVVPLAAACSAAPAPVPAGPRVVSLHDVTSELVLAVGGGDRLVGVAEPVDVEPGTAAAIAGVPRVGDLESILAVRPTLVVGLAVVAAQDPELVARLRGAGVAVYLPEPTTLDDAIGLARELAGRIGAGPAGDALAAQLAAEAAALRPPSGPRHRPRVFVYDCCDPPFTTGRDNAFGDVAAGWTHVSWEAVVARQPALIVIDAYRHDGQGDVADKQRALRAIASLAELPTVVVPLGCSLGGLRSVEGLARLRAAMGGA